MWIDLFDKAFHWIIALPIILVPTLSGFNSTHVCLWKNAKGFSDIISSMSPPIGFTLAGLICNPIDMRYVWFSEISPLKKALFLNFTESFSEDASIVFAGHIISPC